MKSIEKFFVILACTSLIYSTDDDILKKYNLDNLTKTSGENYSGDFGYGTAYFNFNAPILPINGTTCEDPTCVCAAEFGSGGCFCYGTNSSRSVGETTEALVFKYSYDAKAYTLNFICSETDNYTLSSDGLSIEVNWTHPQACPKKSGGKSGLSFGSIALIVIACCVVLYFAIGVPVMHFCLKKTGIEMVPLIHFWLSLPSLVVEGVRFIFSPCCGNRGFQEIE